MQREYNGTPSTGSRLMDRGPLPSRFPSTLSQDKGRVVLWWHGGEEYRCSCSRYEGGGSRTASAREREDQAPDNDRACLERL